MSYWDLAKQQYPEGPSGVPGERVTGSSGRKSTKRGSRRAGARKKRQ